MHPPSTLQRGLPSLPEFVPAICSSAPTLTTLLLDPHRKVAKEDFAAALPNCRVHHGLPAPRGLSTSTSSGGGGTSSSALLGGAAAAAAAPQAQSALASSLSASEGRRASGGSFRRSGEHRSAVGRSDEGGK